MVGEAAWKQYLQLDEICNELESIRYQAMYLAGAADFEKLFRQSLWMICRLRAAFSLWGWFEVAATRLIALHKNKGKSVAVCLKSRTDYAQNPDKTEQGQLVSSYKCSPLTVDEEFMLSKRQYELVTGRRQKNDVIASSTMPRLARSMMPTASRGTVKSFWTPTGRRSLCTRRRKQPLTKPGCKSCRRSRSWTQSSQNC